MRQLRPSTTSYIAFLLLLVSFALLGMFIAALAHGSDMAALAGFAVALTLGAAIAGFTSGA